MKIASWNVNSLNVRLPHLQQWLQEFAPDVVGLQETKLEDNRFPDAVLAGLGYRSVFAGPSLFRRPVQASAISTNTGVWSLGRSQPRGSRSMPAAVQRAFSASLTSTRSMRRPQPRSNPDSR